MHEHRAEDDRRTAGDDAVDATHARRLAEALDRAIALGEWAHADRIAAAVDRIMPLPDVLRERLARLRYAQGRVERALDIIGQTPRTSSLRLLQAACLLSLGQHHKAHALLLRWSRQTTAPLDARLLLAELESRCGNHAAATGALAQNLRQLADHRTLAMLIVLSTERGRSDRAEEWAARLQAATAHGPEAERAALLLCSLGIVPARAAAPLSTGAIDQLAIELVAQESVLPALVAAQRIEPHLPSAALLYAAIERHLDELVGRHDALAALAELADVLGDREASRAWAERGLARYPRSDTLARLAGAPLERRKRDDTADEPVLARIGGDAPPPARERAA